MTNLDQTETHEFYAVNPKYKTQVENLILVEARRNNPDNPFLQFAFEASKSEKEQCMSAFDLRVGVLFRLYRDTESEFVATHLKEELKAMRKMRTKLAMALKYFAPIE